ncbi:shikimate kinase [Paenibacillus flagellatus]|uniref:Shikimate kinase n=1 Tax=Paenibacillus flagellatus TaxID=2211139 RepID=A0A2V5K5B1_9BACL|nr:shikimate kinase [Paenibacillus flagellatus]PYI54438.1 shikimate kinase [Paenibacillus flagellatus]
MNARNIVLIGFMGTGKSTVAHELAQRFGWKRVDLDASIEEAEKATIPQLFADKGEPYFRRAETEALRRELEGVEGRVVATGGGAVLAEENRAIMTANGLVVALTADEETIVRRVKDDPNRPLLQGDLRERVRTLLGQRKHAYDFAHVRIDTSDKTVERIADEIAAHLAR